MLLYRVQGNAHFPKQSQIHFLGAFPGCECVIELIRTLNFRLSFSFQVANLSLPLLRFDRRECLLTGNLCSNWSTKFRSASKHIANRLSDVPRAPLRVPFCVHPAQALFRFFSQRQAAWAGGQLITANELE